MTEFKFKASPRAFKKSTIGGVRPMKGYQYLYTEGVEPCRKEPLKVRLGGVICGEIRKVNGGFQYYPAGAKSGSEVFRTIDLVQQSLKNQLLEE